MNQVQRMLKSSYHRFFKIWPFRLTNDATMKNDAEYKIHKLIKKIIKTTFGAVRKLRRTAKNQIQNAQEKK